MTFGNKLKIKKFIEVKFQQKSMKSKLFVEKIDCSTKG